MITPKSTLRFEEVCIPDERYISKESPALSETAAAILWHNPCWFAARFNFISLKYNQPMYEHVLELYGLSRPEFSVIYTLGLCDGTLARDISNSNGFPKNTLSRAISRLCKNNIIEKHINGADKRAQVLYLTAKGQEIFEGALPNFVKYEEQILNVLDKEEHNSPPW